jgi:hypothetical protein
MFNFITRKLNKKGNDGPIIENPNLPPKLIFLDIDGVLNNANSSVFELCVIEDELVNLLKEIVDKTGAKIVLSTTWRYTKETRQMVNDSLIKNQVPIYINCTPNFGINRTDEILCWLKENTNFKCPDNPEFNVLSSEQSINQNDLPLTELKLSTNLLDVKFIVLDDLDLTKDGNNFSYIGDRFILVDRKVGLTIDNVNLAIKLLNNIL